MSVDLQALLRHPREPARFLASHGGPASEGGGACEQALAALSSAPSCTAEDIDRAVGLAQNAQARCSADELQSGSSLALLVLAGRNYFLASPSQCIPTSRVGRLPSILLSPGDRHDRWPAGTLDPSVSTWSWSRDGLPRRVIDERRGDRLLASITDGLRTIAPRVELFWEMAVAMLSPARRAEVAARIRRERFSLDPRTVEGHRAYLAAGSLWVSLELSDFIANGVRTDASLHCARRGVATVVARFMTHDERVTEAEWAGITAMLERTPPDGSIRECDYVFRGVNHVGVPHEERLRWLGRFDCSEQRAPGFRGHQLAAHLRDTMRGRGYDPLLYRLRGELEWCVPPLSRQQWSPTPYWFTQEAQ